jgi:hypothetical protein
MTGWRAAAVGAALALTGLASACGSDDGGGTAAPITGTGGEENGGSTGGGGKGGDATGGKGGQGTGGKGGSGGTGGALPEAGPDAPIDSGCYVKLYRAGCGTAPVFRSACGNDDASVPGQKCGCDGVTFEETDGFYASRPFAYQGPCVDAGHADAGDASSPVPDAGPDAH